MERRTWSRRARGSSHRAERGQAIVWVAMMLPLFLSIVGLAIDGGIVFSYRRELQNVADAAARAGAMQVDERVYRESAGATVALDVASAQQVAAQYLAARGAGFSGTVAVDSRRVVVQVSRDVPTSFLRVVGISAVRVSATAPAEARSGIAGAGR